MHSSGRISKIVSSWSANGHLSIPLQKPFFADLSAKYTAIGKDLRSPSPARAQYDLEGVCFKISEHFQLLPLSHQNDVPSMYSQDMRKLDKYEYDFYLEKRVLYQLQRWTSLSGGQESTKENSDC